MNNPYGDLPDYAFWRRAVSQVERHALDPIVSTKFKIGREDKVATAGSCFAQHISRALKAIDFNYFIPEDGRLLPPDVRETLNYGVFSARYGNIYTSRQLLQLFEECFDGRESKEAAWLRSDGKWVDPLRPRVCPPGLGSPDAVALARHEHLGCVRRVFAECDTFIFTLGLTETWVSEVDGTAFPVVPGAAGGTFDPERYKFKNLDVREVVEDMDVFLSRLRKVNPSVQVILTVSPVPLIATYEPAHVLCSTAYSKSVLRVAAELLTKRRDWVDYYPSYEIITGSYTNSVYYEPDYRHVSAAGVSHAMRCFKTHYLDRSRTIRSATDTTSDASDIVCDEEAIVKLSS